MAKSFDKLAKRTMRPARLFCVLAALLCAQLAAFSEETDASKFKSLIPADAVEKPVTLVNGYVPGSKSKTMAFSRFIEYFKGDKKVGERVWTQAGELLYEVVYVDGQQDGASHSWYVSGRLASESLFVKGKLNGVATSWHENGKIRETEPWFENKLHGIIRKWDENGMRIKEFGESYRDGKWIGFYNIHGESVTREVYAKAAEADKTLPKLEAED